MSDKISLYSPEQEKAFYEAFKLHRNISPCDANRAAIGDFLDRNLKLPTIGSISFAIQELGNQLAKNSDDVAPVLKVSPKYVAPEPEPEPVDLRKLSTAELRKIIREQNPHKVRLPANITTDYIKTMDRFAFTQLQNRYGSEAVKDRMNGKS